MSQKHRQALILLVGLLYVYSVCPLLCTAFGQRFCPGSPQKFLNGDVKIRASCCSGSEADAADGESAPSESRKLCCSTNLELVLPDDRYNTSGSPELIGYVPVSILPISASSLILPRYRLEPLSDPLTSIFYLEFFLSRRGPPST